MHYESSFESPPSHWGLAYCNNLKKGASANTTCCWNCQLPSSSTIHYIRNCKTTWGECKSQVSQKYSKESRFIPAHVYTVINYSPLANGRRMESTHLEIKTKKEKKMKMLMRYIRVQ